MGSLARLTDAQLEAVRILARHKSRPLTAAPTSESAINCQTGFSLLDRHLAARVLWCDGPYSERIRIAPFAKQLLEADRA